MASPQHLRWLALGGHWQLAHPLAALRDRLRRYGYTVYDLGNEAHLDRQPPEDHTPYSETGWPGTTPYGWVTAIDIMPPPPGSGLPSLQALGRQMHDDRQADVPGVLWLKYLNWGPVSDSSAVHDSWQPSYARRSSGDVGHIHASGRSDHVLTADAAEFAYDPVARLRGQTEEDIMGWLDEDRHGEAMAYRVDALAFGSKVSRGGPLQGERIALVEDVDTIKTAVVELGQAVKDIATAVTQLRELVGAGGTDPQVIEDAAFRAAQRAEQE